jgi:4-hydroxy-4-methyl-2-oxoglutarate aldolase
MKKKGFTIILLLLATLLQAQQVTLTPEQIKALTPEWKGERSADGRPHVPDKLLQRLKAVALEEAWGILRNKGYLNQFEIGRASCRERV